MKDLLYTAFFIENTDIYYWRLFATKKSPLASPECLEVIKRIQNETYSTFPILFIPQNYTVQGYKNLIHSIISNYTLSESDYIDISSYLTSKRLGAIKFLAKVACYNSKLKLTDKNSIDEKFKRLADSLNLYEINGYFASAAYRTYYKLDFVPDDQRNKLKNAIFNNYIAGNKITSWHKKTLPNNYQKSLILDFLTSFVGMSDDSWLDLPVNDFLKVLFTRLQK